MKHLTLLLSALCLPSIIASSEKKPALAVQAAIAFDMSPPLEQFIPDKPVVIHPAVESPPQPQGETKGPGTGLGATPPAFRLLLIRKTMAFAIVVPSPLAGEG